MKKIYLLYSLLIVLIVAVSSCIYEKVDMNSATDTPAPPGPDPDKDKPELKTFYQRFITGAWGFNTYSTPFIIISERDTSAYTYWTKGDIVGVYMKDENGQYLYKNRKYNLTIGAELDGSKLMDDTITTTLQKAICYGYSPYIETLISDNILSYSLNSIQNQSADVQDESGLITNYQTMDERLRNNLLLIAAPSNLFEINGGQCIMTFKNVFTCLCFQVTKSNNISSIGKIKNVKLYIADKNDIETPLNYSLAGEYTLDISKPPYQPTFTSSSNTLSAAVTGGNIINGEYDSPYFWLIVNPITIPPNECMVVIVETDDRQNVQIISKYDISTLNANTIYSFKVEAKTENIVSDEVIKRYWDAEASNSYVVSKAGVHEIPLKTVTGGDLQGDTVVWLWASKTGGEVGFDIRELIDPTTIAFVQESGSKYIRFRAGSRMGKFQEGNVILALKDALGAIVWTWHIWLTDAPQDILYADRSIFLDRNIGALSAEMTGSGIDNYGFVYQWGRKDPFFGGDGIVNEEPNDALGIARYRTIVNTGGGWQSDVAAWLPKIGTTTLTDAIRYPMQFICNNSSLPSKYPADWLSTSLPTLWSNIAKTDYDPCPSGYRVPSAEELQSLLMDSIVDPNTQTSPWYFRHQDNKHWNYYYRGVVTAWPSAGMRQGRTTISDDNSVGAQFIRSGTNYVNGQCFYWTCSPVDAPGIPLGGSYRLYTTKDNLLYGESSGATDYGDNADAYPIRCIKIP